MARVGEASGFHETYLGRNERGDAVRRKRQPGRGPPDNSPATEELFAEFAINTIGPTSCSWGPELTTPNELRDVLDANHSTLSCAYDFVLQRRKGISPNIGFVSKLEAFEEEELGGKSVGVQPATAEDGAGGGGNHGPGGGHGHNPIYGATAGGRCTDMRDTGQNCSW
ncbi:hypothetical protein C8R47DRAFT_1084632 [Mycena vitilis]|nr:hypothetical protein C8R47DRAFT_1084632 [Mycena vitilis]